MIALAEIKPRVVDWLWPNRLALGKLAMFDGDPGRAKSLVTLDLSARITTGRPMPDGTGVAAPANVLIIQGEDFADDTVLPRLRALGADLTRIFVFRKDFLDKSGSFSLPRHVKVLENALAINKPRLLVIDPITAFLGRRIIASSDQSIRRALTPLAELLGQHGCAGILVRHLNKHPSSKSLYRGGGSIGFNAACRSSWLFDFDPKNKGRLIMAQIKNNLAAPQGSIGYQVVLAGTEPILEWLGPSPLSADQLLANRRTVPSVTRDLACEFLSEFLLDGPRPTSEIWEAAHTAGLGRRTLQYARKQLGINSSRVWNGQKLVTYWLMEGQKLPDTIPPEHRPDDIDDLFADVRAQYPLDPLDEAE